MTGHDANPLPTSVKLTEDPAPSEPGCLIVGAFIVALTIAAVVIAAGILAMMGGAQ